MKDKVHYKFWGLALCGVSTWRYGFFTEVKSKTTCKRCQISLTKDGYSRKWR